MDQVGDFLRTLKRLHFWIICGIVILLSLVFWFLSANALIKEQAANAKEYKGLFNDVQQMSSKPRIANRKVASEMDNLLEKKRLAIRDAWKVKHEQQNSAETGILTWPEKKDVRVFTDRIAWMRPIEKFPFPLPESVDRDGRQVTVLLNVGQLERYRDYVIGELPNLAKMIGAEWRPGGRGVGSRPGGERPGPVQEAESLHTQSVVDWDPANQAELKAKHFSWSDDRSFQVGDRQPGSSGNGVPKTIDVFYAQEDLWILRTLMKVIAETNGGAKTRFNAAVKRIDFISIGKSAIVDWSSPSNSRIKTVQGEEVANTGRAGRDWVGTDSSTSFRTRDGLEGNMDEAVLMDPADGRYVDINYAELPGAKLREVLTAETIAPDDAYLAVAKRVPVRFRVSIDQKKLPQLLVACANSKLTVEVRELRLNRTNETGRQTGGNFFQGEQNRRSLGGGGTGAATVRDSFDVTAEIYGIIYLYNPVDNKALGIEEDAEDTTGDSITGATGGRTAT